MPNDVVFHFPSHFPVHCWIDEKWFLFSVILAVKYHSLAATLHPEHKSHWIMRANSIRMLKGLKNSSLDLKCKWIIQSESVRLCHGGILNAVQGNYEGFGAFWWCTKSNGSYESPTDIYWKSKRKKSIWFVISPKCLCKNRNQSDHRCCKKNFTRNRRKEAAVDIMYPTHFTFISQI